MYQANVILLSSVNTVQVIACVKYAKKVHGRYTLKIICFLK